MAFGCTLALWSESWDREALPGPRDGDGVRAPKGAEAPRNPHFSREESGHREKSPRAPWRAPSTLPPLLCWSGSSLAPVEVGWATSEWGHVRAVPLGSPRQAHPDGSPPAAFRSQPEDWASQADWVLLSLTLCGLKHSRYAALQLCMCVRVHACACVCGGGDQNLFFLIVLKKYT